MLSIVSAVTFGQGIQRSSYKWFRGSIGGFKEQASPYLGGITFNLNICRLDTRLIQMPTKIKNTNDLWTARLGGYANFGDEHNMGIYYDADLLYGKCTGGTLNAYISGGAGIMGGYYAERQVFPPGVLMTVDRKFINLNVPLEAGINLNSKVIGIGLAAFVNLNRTRPLTGFFICLNLGRVK